MRTMCSCLLCCDVRGFAFRAFPKVCRHVRSAFSIQLLLLKTVQSRPVQSETLIAALIYDDIVLLVLTLVSFRVMQMRLLALDHDKHHGGKRQPVITCYFKSSGLTTLQHGVCKLPCHAGDLDHARVTARHHLRTSHATMWTATADIRAN